MTGPIRHILFDLGNVLVPLNWDKALAALMPHLPPAQAELLKRDRKAFMDSVTEPATALEMGFIEFQEFYRQVCALLDISVSFAQFHLIWCDIFEMDEAMTALGRQLSARYGTWLVSNTSRVHYDWIIERFPSVVFYRKAALSFELGAMKPEREYYEKALKLFDIKADQSLFIDDLEDNTSGARRCGIWSIVFRGKDKLMEELRNAGVHVY